MDVLTKLSKARTQLLLDRRYVFWATIGMYQQLIKIDDSSMLWRGLRPTMATDGHHLYYSESFVESLTNAELMGVLAHEAGHCALGHHMRCQQRQPLPWNAACDFALNLILHETGLTLPKGGLLDKKWKGMSAEEIYAKFPVRLLKGLEGWDFGGVLDGTGSEEDRKRWEVIVRQAAEQAKAQGHLPGDFEYLIKPLRPKLDLHSMLRHLFSAVQEDDYSWAKPNRRHIFKDMYLPSLRTESMGEILVAIDVSGSIGKQDAAKFLGIVNLVLSDLKPKVVHFIQCDAAVQSHEEITRGNILPESVKIRGGGGTDMRPIWEWAQGKKLVCGVVCSDFMMDVPSFGEQQNFPVLWVTCTKDCDNAPWGQTVRLSEV